MQLKIRKFALCVAVSAVLVGCGGKNGKSAFYATPKVASDAMAVVAVGGGQGGNSKAFADKVRALFKDFREEVPKEARDLFEKMGVDEWTVRWALLSVGNVNVKEIEEEGEVPDVALAVSFDHDLNRIVTAVQETARKEEKPVEFRLTKVAGVDAWEIHSKEFKTPKKTVVPCVCSLDGKLLLAAPTAAALERQIALYRDGKGISSDFADFKLNPDDLVKVMVIRAGEKIREALGGDAGVKDLKMINALVPDGDKMLLGMDNSRIAVTAEPGTKARLCVSLKMASEPDADKVRTLAKTGLMAATAQLKENSDKDSRAILAALQDAKVGGSEGSAEVSVTIPAGELLDTVLKDLLH